MRDGPETRIVGNRLVIVGTIHVDPASAILVRETVRDLRPEVVALELDAERLRALQSPSTARPSLSSGPSFLAMALLEKFAGQLTGSSPGLEMLEAVRGAEAVGARIELIDRPIGATIAGIRRLPLREKLMIGVDGVASLVLLPFGVADLSKLTEEIDSQLGVFRRRYPFLSQLLLDQREHYMAEKLKKVLDETSGKVLAIVGFGHLSEIAKALEGYQERPGYSTSVTWTLGTASAPGSTSESSSPK